MAERAKIFDASIDVDDEIPPVAPEQIRAVSEAANFPSREVAKQKKDRRYRSGRTAQIHLKAKPEYAELFIELCERAGVEKQVEGFEQALKAWKRELDDKQ